MSLKTWLADRLSKPDAQLTQPLTLQQLLELSPAELREKNITDATVEWRFTAERAPLYDALRQLHLRELRVTVIVNRVPATWSADAAAYAITNVALRWPAIAWVIDDTRYDAITAAMTRRFPQLTVVRGRSV